MGWSESYARAFPELPVIEGPAESLTVLDLSGVQIYLPAESQWAFYWGVLCGMEIGKRRTVQSFAVETPKDG